MAASEVDRRQGEDAGGCLHYRNKCQILASCCESYYRCHRCHNEEREHLCGLLDRPSIRKVRCVECSHVQNPAEECSNCHVKFAEYVCLKCNLFRQAATESGLYHCSDCGICRVGKGLGDGGSHWHCHSCCACLPNSLDHVAHLKVCRAEALKDNCAICFFNMHDSTEECVAAPYCGHYLHRSCYEGYLNSGKIKCPLCQKPMIDESIIKRAERRECVVQIFLELARTVVLYMTCRFIGVSERDIGDMDIGIFHCLLFFFRVGAQLWWEGPRREGLHGMSMFLTLMLYVVMLLKLLGNLI